MENGKWRVATRVLGAIALSIGALAQPARAQSMTGLVLGTVRDADGAVLPGVAVVAKQPGDSCEPDRGERGD
jgi:hypothetical protein